MERNRWHGWCIAQAEPVITGTFQAGQMSERFQTDNRELDDLFERYRAAPKGHVFAPLADACRKAGMLDEALEICARGVGEHPRYASGYVVQGKCLYDAGRIGDAQAAFDRVLDLDPKNLVALKYLGIIHAERGDPSRAKEFFEHILALDPGDREIRSRMEDVSIRRPQASTRVLTPVVTAVAAPTPPPPVRDAPPQAPTVEEDPVELPDVEDERFEGEPITLRDESVTSDEIATITLADIYASQGYTTRALRIYRDVQKRQPANTTLAAKIEKLEKLEQKPVAPTAMDAPAATAPPSRAEQSPHAPASERASRTPAPESPSRPPAPASLDGSPIDQTRSYEQFKRWLKASSR
jgi:tetratricopeptide (TPR) repeat protein